MKLHEWGTRLLVIWSVWATRLSLFNEYGHWRSASPRIVDKRQPGGSLDKDGRNVSGGVRNMEPAWLAAGLPDLLCQLDC
jgi:hypothetical protein